MCVCVSWDVAVANAFLLSTLSRLSKGPEGGEVLRHGRDEKGRE